MSNAWRLDGEILNALAFGWSQRACDEAPSPRGVKAAYEAVAAAAAEADEDEECVLARRVSFSSSECATRGLETQCEIQKIVGMICGLRTTMCRMFLHTPKNRTISQILDPHF